MSKKKFNFEDYIGRYAMHCPEKWQADVFFEKLIDEKADLWERFGLRTPIFNEWDRFKRNTCYGFNDCTVGAKRNFEGYKVLEFEDFEWDESNTFNSLFELFLMLMAVNSPFGSKGNSLEDGFCPKCGSKTKMLKVGGKYFMVCEHCEKAFCVSGE